LEYKISYHPRDILIIPCLIIPYTLLQIDKLGTFGRYLKRDP